MYFSKYMEIRFLPLLRIHCFWFFIEGGGATSLTRITSLLYIFLFMGAVHDIFLLDACLCLFVLFRFILNDPPTHFLRVMPGNVRVIPNFPRRMVSPSLDDGFSEMRPPPLNVRIRFFAIHRGRVSILWSSVDYCSHINH